MTEYDISVKEVEPIRAAVIRDVVQDYSSTGPLFEQIYAELDLYGIVPAGPDMALYYDEEYREQDVDVEAAVPVEEGELPDEPPAQPRRKVHGHGKVPRLAGRHGGFPGAQRPVRRFHRSLSGPHGLDRGERRPHRGAQP